MMSLNLYKQGDTWKFDDKYNNIKAETFVLGMSEMIDFYVGDEKIKHTTITFSHNKFPKCYDLNLIEEDSNGGWYFDTNSKKRVWLCTVRIIHMKDTPKNIFFLVTNNKKAEKKGLLNKIIKKIKSI